MITQPNVLLGRKDYVLLLSHMRSRSTLLSHILGSHPEISGYSELHQEYRSRLDLARMRYRACCTSNNRLKGRFVLDKVLHDRYVVSETILKSPNVRLIFMLREPEDTLRSIIRMRAEGEEGRDVDVESVLEYYTHRLDHLQRLAEKAGRESFFLQSERLVQDTSVVLESLAGWLGLQQPLSEEYSIFEYTGVPVYGDSSSVIREGRVVKAKRELPPIALPPEIVDQARSTYSRCQSVMASICSNV